MNEETGTLKYKNERVRNVKLIIFERILSTLKVTILFFILVNGNLHYYHVYYHFLMTIYVSKIFIK